MSNRTAQHVEPGVVLVLEIPTGEPSQAELEAAARRAQWTPGDDEDDSCPF